MQRYIHLVSLANSDGGPVDVTGLLPGSGRDDGKLVSVDVAMETGGCCGGGLAHSLLGSTSSASSCLSSSPANK